MSEQRESQDGTHNEPLENSVTPPELPTEKSSAAEFSRRHFVGLTAAAAASLTATGLLINERHKSDEGIVTDYGIFRPAHYEYHNKTISPEMIPADINVLFREIGFQDNVSNLSPQKILTATNQYNLRFLPDDVLRKLANQNTEVGVGDVFRPDATANNRLSTLLLEASAGVATALGNVTHSAFSEKPKNTTALTRRNFLKLFGYGAAAWATAPAYFNLTQLTSNTQRGAAAERILTRLNGLQSNLHPEDSTIFFRNLIMADKMHLLSEDHFKKTGQKSKMSYIIGAEHGGIEDFLQLGPELCRYLITSYPKEVLTEWIKASHGIDNFTAAHLLNVPQEAAANPTDLNNWQTATKTTIMDTELRDALQTKLN